MGDTNNVHTAALQAPMFGPTTQAIHADDSLNNVEDVAPPMHVSTTFRYTNDPDRLIPAADAEVCLLRTCTHSSMASLRPWADVQLRSSCLFASHSSQCYPS